MSTVSFFVELLVLTRSHNHDDQLNVSFGESRVILKRTSTVGVGQDPLRHVIVKAVGHVEETAESS